MPSYRRDRSSSTSQMWRYLPRKCQLPHSAPTKTSRNAWTYTIGKCDAKSSCTPALWQDGLYTRQMFQRGSSKGLLMQSSWDSSIMTPTSTFPIPITLSFRPVSEAWTCKRTPQSHYNTTEWSCDCINKFGSSSRETRQRAFLKI